MHSDSELIAAAIKGNRLAFRQIVERHERQIRSTVVGMLGDVVEAEDITQEVFVRFYKVMSKYKEEAALSTYLTRIAINLSLNEIKKRKRKSKWLGYAQTEEQAYQIADSTNDSERLEKREIIRKALARLDTDFRAVVVLRLIDGYSVKETAEILDIPQGTVASRLLRAQKKLQAIINKISE
ncbi:MAG: RNA polymerase sigma factor [Bacteroidota bacterium]